MAKRKQGLHKQVSAIFDGVPVPKSDGGQESTQAPAADRAGQVPPKVPAPRHLTPPMPKAPQPALTQPTAKPPQRPRTAPMPKPQRPEQPLSKAARPKQPEAEAAVKPERRIPSQQPAQWQQTLERIKNKLLAPKPGVNPARQKAMVVLVPLLFIVLIFVFTQVLSVPSPKATGAQSAGGTNAAAGSGKKIDWQIPDLYPTTLRDPMQFGSVTVPQVGGTSGLIVRAIVYSKDDPVALIGRRRVHEGDKILGATVVKINEGSVEFEMSGKRWTQRVQQR